MNPQLRAVVNKELIDAFRDRRALLSALLFPLLGPVLLAGMFAGIEHSIGGEDRVSLPTSGAANAPGLVRFLDEHGVDVTAAPADSVAAVKSRESAVVMHVPANFARDFEAGRPAHVTLVLDRSRTSSSSKRRRVRRLINAYGARIASFRLMARGVSPDVVTPIAVETVDLATPKGHSANLLHVVSLFVILAVFIGSMQVAIDTTAGERERGSLEALLLNPVSRFTLVVGKWLVALIFGSASAAITLTLTAFVLPQVPLENIGIAFRIGWFEVGIMFIIVLPLAPFAASLQLVGATFARSFKEAQTYLSLLLFVPMLPGFAAQVLGFSTKWWMIPIPALGQQALMGDLLRGDDVPFGLLLLAAASSVLLALLLLRLCARLFEREGIIFAGQ